MMTPEKKENKFFKQFILGFGFLQGLWTAIGINPGLEVFKFANNTITKFNPNLEFSFVLNVLPIILVSVALYFAYKYGGPLGIISVLMGYVAGISVLASWKLSLGLLVYAWVIGYIGTKNN